MSIVINGIGMPVDCTRCPCSDDETRFCRAANKYIPMLGKPKFCPLAEIITCKDCKNNYNTWLTPGANKPMCDFTDRALKENDFCSRGERRE